MTLVEFVREPHAVAHNDCTDLHSLIWGFSSASLQPHQHCFLFVLSPLSLFGFIVHRLCPIRALLHMCRTHTELTSPFFLPSWPHLSHTTTSASFVSLPLSCQICINDSMNLYKIQAIYHLYRMVEAEWCLPFGDRLCLLCVIISSYIHFSSNDVILFFTAERTSTLIHTRHFKNPFLSCWTLILVP